MHSIFCTSLIQLISFFCIVFTQYSHAKAQENSQNDYQHTVCKVIAESYLSYYESFSLVDCRYSVDIGFASSLNRGIAPGYSHLISANGIWLVNGQYLKIGVNADIKQFADLWKSPEYTVYNELGQKVQRTPMTQINILDNGSYLLHQNPSFQLATVLDPSFRTPATMYTPLDMGTMGWGSSTNPGRDILRHLEQRKHVKLIQSDDNSSLVIEVGNSARDIYCKYFFDPRKNYFLTRIERYKEMNVVEISSIIDSRKLPDGRWFPFRSITACKSLSEKYKYDVCDITTKTISVDTIPADTEFQIILSANTVVTSGIPGISITLATEEPVELRTIKDLLLRIKDREEDQRVLRNSNSQKYYEKHEPIENMTNFRTGYGIAGIFLSIIIFLGAKYLLRNATHRL